MNKEIIQNRVEDIENLFFSESRFFDVESSMESIPLIAANVCKSTNSFTEGQLLYIYSGFWGENENFKVVGRFRRKNRIIKGVCPISSLSNLRPKIVYDKKIIYKLAGTYIDIDFSSWFSVTNKTSNN